MVKRLSYRSDLQSIYSQNMHGIKTYVGLCEVHGSSWARDAFAVCGQETWRCGAELHEREGYTFVGIGPAQQIGRGVSISLSRRAASAWERENCEKHDDVGSRLLAVRLTVRCGHRGKQYHRMMSIFLISGYAPTSGHAAAEHDATTW